MVKLTYTKPIAIVEQYVEAHRAFLTTGYEKNYFIASGPQNPRIGGIIISQLTERAQLETFLRDDPFALNEIATYELIEFTPVKYHPDFACFLN